MIITVRVNSHAQRNRVQQISPTEYKVWVSVAPEHGKANKKVIALLAEFLSIPPSLIELTSGPTSRTKIFSILQ